MAGGRARVRGGMSESPEPSAASRCEPKPSPQNENRALVEGARRPRPPRRPPPPAAPRLRDPLPTLDPLPLSSASLTGKDAHSALGVEVLNAVSCVRRGGLFLFVCLLALTPPGPQGTRCHEASALLLPALALGRPEPCPGRGPLFPEPHVSLIPRNTFSKRAGGESGCALVVPTNNETHSDSTH